MIVSVLPPGLILMLGALFVCLLSGRGRSGALLLTPVVAGYFLMRLDGDSSFTVGFLDYQLSLLRVDELSSLFAIVFLIVTFIGGMYSLHVKRASEHASALLYASGALGVVFAGDWITLFVFWELMAGASVFLIWFKGGSAAIRSGYRYLLVHTAGGGLLLAGILMHLAGGGSPEVGSLTGTSGPAFWLILLGVALNAAIPPLHAWLPDAYAEATVTGSVFLSAFTTKTAVYVLLRVFPGTEILIGVGVAMALYGVVFAVLENDIRRLLAYHIVSQVGYMVAGAGMGSELAINGASAHAFSHILYKSLLFMGVGSVIFVTGRNKLSELGGIARKMPVTVFLYAVGAASISGVPFFSGFISKSMVISAAAEGHWGWAELLLVLASVGTFLHTGLKLLYFTFMGPDKGIEAKEPPLNMLIAMGIGAGLCFFFGMEVFVADLSGSYHSLLYSWLPFQGDYHPYSWDHFLGACQILLGTFLGFYLLLSKLGGETTLTLDTDWPYRRFTPAVVNGFLFIAGRLAKYRIYFGHRLDVWFRNLTHNPVRNSFSSFEKRGMLEPVHETTPGYHEDTDRLPISITLGSALVILVLVALGYWISI